MEEALIKCAARELGILQLAYMGDAVIEIFTRSTLLSHGNYPSGKLVKMSKAFVTCEAQSDAVDRILPLLNAEEESFYRRGRNAKTHYSPAHGSPGQYNKATGFEALMGYLYMSGNEKRARELFDAAYCGVAEEMIEKIK